MAGPEYILPLNPEFLLLSVHLFPPLFSQYSMASVITHTDSSVVILVPLLSLALLQFRILSTSSFLQLHPKSIDRAFFFVVFCAPSPYQISDLVDVMCLNLVSTTKIRAVPEILDGFLEDPSSLTFLYHCRRSFFLTIPWFSFHFLL